MSTLAKPQKIVDEEYKLYVVSHPCLVCTNRETDGDHLLARGTGSASQNDYSLIPLCRQHHSERHQIGNQKFETKYTVNLWREAWRLLSRWIEMRKLQAELERIMQPRTDF